MKVMLWLALQVECVAIMYTDIHYPTAVSTCVYTRATSRDLRMSVNQHKVYTFYLVHKL